MWHLHEKCLNTEDEVDRCRYLGKFGEGKRKVERREGGVVLRGCLCKENVDWRTI